MTLEQQFLGPVPDFQSRGQDEITWLPGLHEAFPPGATRKHLSYLLTLNLIGLQADSLFEGLEKGAFGSVVNLYLFIVVGRLLCNRAKPVVGISPAIGGGCPWSPQQMTWTPRPSSQPRKVSRVGRGTVQTSSQMITWRMYFCPILSGVHSTGHFNGRSCGRSGSGGPWPASLWPGGGSG